MMDFFELLVKRRSIRDFREQGVAPDTVMEIIKDSCLAPSAGNDQPWRFIVVNDKDLIKKLSDESKKNLLADFVKDPDSPVKRYVKILRDPTYNVYYNAPCLLFIVGPKEHRSLHVDCALAAAYFMFSATARGLGTCWIGLGASIRDLGLIEEIGLPEGHIIVAPIIVGYPKSIPTQIYRKDPRILKIISSAGIRP
jgi:nitroreductase